ncbi:hypothetical protein [Actinokineospora sp. UTMC 2448]|uniref:hypothetical protein n=1 Tax=Actinokineospora sp. UTMC 2448 TaxID=2268449 RepID=UPI002164A17C|nr:hypothetical protein [Actinokineospora sp. UTMC 2448]
MRAAVAFFDAGLDTAEDIAHDLASRAGATWRCMPPTPPPRRSAGARHNSTERCGGTR